MPADPFSPTRRAILQLWDLLRIVTGTARERAWSGARRFIPVMVRIVHMSPQDS